MTQMHYFYDSNPLIASAPQAKASGLGVDLSRATCHVLVAVSSFLSFLVLLARKEVLRVRIATAGLRVLWRKAPQGTSIPCERVEIPSLGDHLSPSKRHVLEPIHLICSKILF